MCNVVKNLENIQKKGEFKMKNSLRIAMAGTLSIVAAACVSVSSAPSVSITPRASLIEFSDKPLTVQ